VDRRLPYAIALLALALAGASLASLARHPARPCQIDEPAWITSSYVTFQLLTEAAPPSRWERAYEDKGLAFWGNMNPPVGKLLTGVWVAAFRDAGDPVDYQWQWPLSYEENQARGNIPPRSLLVPVRLFIVVSALATLAALYAFAIQLTGNPWTALLAPAALYFSPIFQIHATQVYMDVPQLAFLALAIAAFAAEIRRPRPWAFAASLVALGLACAVKFSSAPLVLATGLFVLARPQSWRRRLTQAAAVAVVPFAVFVAVNPYLYPDPLGRSHQFLTEWAALKETQKQDPALAESVVTSPVAGLDISLRTTVAKPPFAHPAFGALRPHVWLAAVLAAALLAWGLWRFQVALPPLRSRRWRQGLAAGAGLWLVLWALGVAGASLLLALCGVAWLFGIGDSGRSRELAAYTVLCASTMVVFTGLWLPFVWWRYFLPPLLLMAPLYAAGGAFLLSVAATRVPRLPRGSSANQSAASPNATISESVAPTTKLAGR
jgi:4-amino-4-deoxy-L-arabinose transferase-like glycosyltransferase